MDVPRHSIDELTPERFRDEYMAANLPVLLTGVGRSWRATREWVTADGKPDVSALERLFGSDMIEAVECGGKRRRREMSVAEYVGWWTQHESVQTDQDASKGAVALYLKDWTFAASWPKYGAYTPPPHVKDDWLNEHWAAESGDGDPDVAAPDGARSNAAGSDADADAQRGVGSTNLVPAHNAGQADALHVSPAVDADSIYEFSARDLLVSVPQI